MARRRRGIEDSYLKCPTGHVLPHEKCTPVYCLENTAKGPAHTPKELAPLVVQTNAELEAMLPGEAAEFEPEAKVAGREHLQKLALSAGRRAARKAFAKIPEGMDAATSEEWSKAYAAGRLPYALAELDYQLMLGDDKQRADAARDFLDINGMRKRDGTGNGGATIILNLGGKELPWAQKVVAKLTTGSDDASE